MRLKVANNAYKQDIYLIKFSSMQFLVLQEQLNLLNEYIEYQESTIKETESILEQLESKNTIDHWCATKQFELRIDQAKLAIEWAKKFANDLNEKMSGERNV